MKIKELRPLLIIANIQLTELVPSIFGSQVIAINIDLEELYKYDEYEIKSIIHQHYLSIEITMSNM